mgnify:CR=1 FL=1
MSDTGETIRRQRRNPECNTCRICQLCSPVDFISGERYVSIPFNFAKENVGTFTYHLRFSFGYISSIPCSFRFFPRTLFVAISAKPFLTMQRSWELALVLSGCLYPHLQVSRLQFHNSAHEYQKQSWLYTLPCEVS